MSAGTCRVCHRGLRSAASIADFALNALLALRGGLVSVDRGVHNVDWPKPALYQEFKRRFVARLPHAGGVIGLGEVARWMAAFEAGRLEL